MNITSTGAAEQQQPAAPAQQSEPVHPGAAPAWATSGGQAINAYQEELKRIQARKSANALKRKMPFRFYVKPGNKADIIILDNDFGPAILEHDLRNHPQFKQINPRTGYPKDRFVTSCTQFETDPLITNYGSQPYFVTFLTIIDMRSGVTRKGKPFANVKKLLPLRGDAMAMLSQIRQQRIEEGHTKAPLRGVHLIMQRGTDNFSLRTGLPMFVRQYEDADVIETFKHPAEYDDQGQQVKAENEDCFPVDYSQLFPKPTAKAICEELNIEPPQSVGAGHGMGGAAQGASQGVRITASAGGSPAPTEQGEDGAGESVGSGGLSITPSMRTRARPAATVAPSAAQPAAGPQAGNSAASTPEELDDDIPF